MAEPVLPRHGGTRLIGVEFPGMEIKHDRTSLQAIDPFDAEPFEPKRQQPEEAPATNGKVQAAEARRPDWEFRQRGAAGAPDFIGKSRRTDIPVAIVVNRIGARVVLKAFFQKNPVRPRLLAS